MGIYSQWLTLTDLSVIWRKGSRYQRDNQKAYFQGQTTQWPKDKGQKDNDLQNATQKTNDWATWSPLKTEMKGSSAPEV